MKKVLKDILTEKYGKWSFGRVTGTLLLIWQIILVSYISIERKEVVDFSEWVAIIIIGLYGINKGAEAFGKYNGSTSKE